MLHVVRLYETSARDARDGQYSYSGAFPLDEKRSSAKLESCFAALYLVKR